MPFDPNTKPLVNKESKPSQPNTEPLETLETSALNAPVEESPSKPTMFDTPSIESILSSSSSQKVFFVYDRDTVLEAEVVNGEIGGLLNLKVPAIQTQKFTTSITEGAKPADFLNVRKGTGRADVGSYFVEE